MRTSRLMPVDEAKAIHAERSAGTGRVPADDPLPAGQAADLRERLQPHVLQMVESAGMITRLTEAEKSDVRRKLLTLAARPRYRDREDQLTPNQQERVVATLMDDLLGFGPLQPWLDDPDVSEILINGPSEVFVERQGRLERLDSCFQDREHLVTLVDRLLATTGRRATTASPYVDARLGEGIRVNVTVAPVAIDGPYVTIRKPLRNLLSMASLVALGTITEEAARFLSWCVRGRLNIVASGPASSGKTTLLNVLANTIPPDERIVLIEDTAELQLRYHHVVRLESHPPNFSGQGEVTIRQLVKNALHMRPDRILVGEVRGEEALDMLQAMNTGSDGSMATLHANAPADVLDRIVTMALFSRTDLSIEAVWRQARAAIDLIVQLERCPDGRRRLTHICELRKEQPDVPPVELFALAGGTDGRERLRPTGTIPACLARLSRLGVQVPASLFAG